MRLRKAVGLCCCLLLGAPGLASPAQGAATAAMPAWPSLETEALQVLQQYLRINTSNPPGNEAEAAHFLAAVLERHGIAASVIPILPGRAALYARLRGDGSRRPLILLSHMDVVPATARDWSSPPFAGAIVDDELYGRGTIDIKSLGVEELFTLIALKQSGARLHRDVILLATPDEENGSRWGAGWIVQHRPDLFAGAEYLINEGGGVQQFADRDLVSIEVTQKVPLWVRVIATGEALHAATPPAEDAVVRLLDALDRIRQMPLPPRLLPQVSTMLRTLSPWMMDETLQKGFQHPEEAIHQDAFWQALQQNPGFGWYNALLRSTVAITKLRGSHHINTIPAEAEAELDCRLLPGDDPQEMLRRLREAAGDPSHIHLEVLLSGHETAAASTSTDLYRAIVAASRRAWPNAVVLPSLSAGFTDSHFFRDEGIECYGWDAVELTPDEAGRAHASNERIRPEAFEQAIPVLYEAVRQVVE